MAEDVLLKLADNSHKAIDEGTYDVDVRVKGSDIDLVQSIRTNQHATIIAEIKFSSPSLGRIRDFTDPAGVARQMVHGGASALSVLTQPYMFGGSPDHLLRVRDAVEVPLLMKDIIVDSVQIDAGRRIGADYILLIQSLFDRGHVDDIDGFIRYGHRAGLKILLEVHTRAELENASRTDADIIGINNRNLDTLEIDLGTSGRILSGLEDVGPIISESGIETPEDIRYLKKCGADAFLVGSSIMNSSCIGEHVRGLVNAY